MENEADERSLDKPKRYGLWRKKLLLAAMIPLGTVSLYLILGFISMSTCPQIPIAPTTSVSIASGNYTDFPFNVTQMLPGQRGRSILGSLTSINGGVIVYGMTSSQFASFVSTRSPTSYFYDSGPTLTFNYNNGNCGRYCGPNPPVAPLGNDHLVLVNPGQTSIIVQITMEIYVVAC